METLDDTGTPIPRPEESATTATAIERERCAHIAETAWERLYLAELRCDDVDNIRAAIGRAIAAKIRSGKC